MTVLTFPAKSRPAERIEARIEALRRHLAHMAEVNRLLANNDVEGLRSLGYDDTQIGLLMIPDSLGCPGFSERTFAEVEAKVFQLERGLSVPAITSAPGFDGRA